MSRCCLAAADPGARVVVIMSAISAIIGGLLAKILDATERYQAPPTEAEMVDLTERAAMTPLFV